MEKNSLREPINRAIDKLPGDLGTVLVLRYGLRDSARQSIGRIAKLLKTKMSSIVRMEIKGIRSLRRPALCIPFFAVLDEMVPYIWNEISEKISEAGSLIRKSNNFDMLTETLPGEIDLAIKCRYGSLQRWIECNAFEFETAWFRSKYPPETVIERLHQLTGFWNRTESPFLIGHLIGPLNVDVPFLRFMLALSPLSTGFYGGYVAERPIMAPVLRAIRLHLLLLYQYADTSVSVDDIVKNYNSLYHDNQLTERLAEIIMRARPHLFVEAGEGRWSVLGSVREHRPYSEVDDVVPDDEAVREDMERKKPAFFYQRPWSETTASDIVREILEERSFFRRKSILDAFLERCEGRYEYVSAQAALTMNDDILEVAPRVYGIRSNCNNLDPVHAWSEILLTRKDCKAFILDRYAGEPLNTYPLWTPNMEQQWCIWAERNSELNLRIGFGGDSDRHFNRKLFESLLFVSEPEHWSVPDSIKSLWLFRKQALSTYHFNKPVQYPLWRRNISLQDIFSVAAATKRLGYANWVQTSQALGLGRHSMHSAEALILLIALEMILPTDDWQKKHQIGAQIDSSLRLMVEEIKKKGFVHWMDETGAYFRNRMREKIDHIQLGWVCADWIRDFLDVLEGNKTPKQAVEKAPSQTLERVLIKDSANSTHPTKKPEQLTLPF